MMNQSKENKSNVSQDLINEMKANYNDILKNKTIKELLDVLSYEVEENERYQVLNMTVNEFLEDWANDGLY